MRLWNFPSVLKGRRAGGFSPKACPLPSSRHSCSLSTLEVQGLLESLMRPQNHLAM